MVIVALSGIFELNDPAVAISYFILCYNRLYATDSQSVNEGAVIY